MSCAPHIRASLQKKHREKKALHFLITACLGGLLLILANNTYEQLNPDQQPNGEPNYSGFLFFFESTFFVIGALIYTKHKTLSTEQRNQK